MMPTAGNFTETGSGGVAAADYYYDGNAGTNSTAVVGGDANHTTTNGFYGSVESPSPLPQCAFEQPPLTDVRFWIVTVFGTCVSLISIVENSFFFYLFSTRKHHRTTYNMYMMFLAFFDFFVSGAYVLLMSVNVLSDYVQSPVLIRIWFHYMVPILTVSHCGITSSSFLILAATFERYCLTVNSKYVRFVQKNRKYIIVFAVIFGIISKGTICFEFKISYVEECAGTMTEFQLQFAEFVYGTPYHTVWRFWYRNFVTVFFPFFALLALNIRIVRALTKAERQSLSLPNTNSKQFKRKKVARSATRTTVLVVFTYLISNIINVILTTWEHLDKTLLVTDYVQAYAIALDLASLLTNFASAIRPPIYLICQPTLRAEVFNFFKKQWCAAGGGKKPITTTTTTTTTTTISGSVTNLAGSPPADLLFGRGDKALLSNGNAAAVGPGAASATIVTSIGHAADTTRADSAGDVTEMDLLRDEADLDEEEESYYDDDDDDDGHGLIGGGTGRLEAMAARMRRRKQVALANSRLASMVAPSCITAVPCLTTNNNSNSATAVVHGLSNGTTTGSSNGVSVALRRANFLGSVGGTEEDASDGRQNGAVLRTRARNDDDNNSNRKLSMNDGVGDAAAAGRMTMSCTPLPSRLSNDRTVANALSSSLPSTPAPRTPREEDYRTASRDDRDDDARRRRRRSSASNAPAATTAITDDDRSDSCWRAECDNEQRRRRRKRSTTIPEDEPLEKENDLLTTARPSAAPHLLVATTVVSSATNPQQNSTATVVMTTPGSRTENEGGRTPTRRSFLLQSSDKETLL